MKYIKLGYLMFLKNFKLNLVVILQIVALVLLGVNLFSLISIGVRASNALSPITNSNFVYYMSTENYLNMISFGKREKDASNDSEYLNITNVKFKTRIFITDAITDNKADIITKIYAYDKPLIDFLKLPLKEGHWFSQTTNNSGVIDAVSNQNSLFKVGDIIHLKVNTQSLKQLEIKVRIIGTLKNPAYLPNTQHLSQSAFSLTIADDVSYNKTGLPTILINSQDVEKIENVFMNALKSEFIVFDDNISDEEYQLNLKEMKKSGIIATSEDIANNDYEWISSLLYENMPMMIFIFVLSLVGLICISLINMTNYIRTFSIYFICGATLKACYKIIISYLFIIFLWAVLLSLILTLIFCNVSIPVFSLIEINSYSCAWVLIIIATYFAFSILGSLFFLKRSTIKEALNKSQ